MTSSILVMKNITKEFPGVKALDNVSFQVKQGEIHCLVGENGAGKSTLMKILSGVYPYGDYQGEIIINNEEQRFRFISESEKAGIAIIYQEFALVSEMTVYENIFLGHEIKTNLLVNLNETIKQAGAILQKVRLNINPITKVKDLGVGQQQLVEIAKALSREVKLLILDEPTSALNENDIENLFDLLRELKHQGVTIVLITHKLKEVIDVADTVTVLRDGKTICTLDATNGEVSESILIKHMVGREIENIYPPRGERQIGETIFDVKEWNTYNPILGRQLLKDMSFHLRRGEIIGFAGLMGSGRTELALSLFGNPQNNRIDGEMFVRGKVVQLNHPREAIKQKLAYVSEDRKSTGLILIQDVKENITLANLSEISKHGIIDQNAEIKIADQYKESIDIRTPSIEQKVQNLSGGNQQKVSLAKWLFAKPDILILDEPTRGIDVGAKFEIYTIMNQLVEQGMSIIMISSELPEILGMSDRVYIVAEGNITGELSIEEATQENIMHLATK